MVDIDADAIKIGFLVGGGALTLLFVGQALSVAAWWVGRAISGAALLLLAVGLGYVAYQLYSGWTAADEESYSQLDEAQFGRNSDTQTNSVEDAHEQYIDDTLSEQELEEELERLMQDERDTEDIAREVD